MRVENKLGEQELEAQLKEAVKNAQSLALIPVIKLLKHTLGFDFSSKLGIDVSKQSGNIEITKSNGDIVQVCLDIVDSEYDIMKSFNDSGLYDENVSTFLDLPEEIKEETIELVSYMMKSTLLVFNNLKNEDLKLELAEYQMDMDENTRLFILTTSESSKYISVVFNKIQNTL
jgi:hypothetical protein